jgi:hypothetical protein
VGESEQLELAHLSADVLAGFVYVGRAMLGEWAILAAERPEMEDLGNRLEKIRSRWLCKATYSSMKYV